MNPYDFTDYRSYLEAICDRDEAPRGYRATLAKSAGCQASYFSQALKRRVHLSEDQLIGVSAQLNLSRLETEYLLLLQRKDKAGTKALREYLQKSIENLRQETSNLKNRVPADATVQNPESLALYFSSWIPSAVHLLTSSTKTQTASAISERLSLPIDKVQSTLEMLNQLGLVRKQGRNWIYEGGSLHVPKDSPVQTALQLSRRDMARRSIAVNLTSAMHFSSLFTIDETDFQKLREILSRAIEKGHGVVKSSGTDRLVCLCLDLFEVI